MIYIGKGQTCILDTYKQDIKLIIQGKEAPYDTLRVYEQTTVQPVGLHGPPVISRYHTVVTTIGNNFVSEYKPGHYKDQTDPATGQRTITVTM